MFHSNFIFCVLAKTWIFLFVVIAPEPIPPCTTLRLSGDFVLPSLLCYLLIKHWIIQRWGLACWRSGNVLHSLLAGAPFGFPSGHLLSWLRFPSFSSLSLGKCRDSISIRRRPLPSRSSLIHHSPILSFSAGQSSQLKRRKMTHKNITVEYTV
jgi:hypothetical protein